MLCGVSALVFAWLSFFVSHYQNHQYSHESWSNFSQLNNQVEESQPLLSSIASAHKFEHRKQQPNWIFDDFIQIIDQPVMMLGLEVVNTPPDWQLNRSRHQYRLTHNKQANLLYKIINAFD